jgi:hypothetical protein
VVVGAFRFTPQPSNDFIVRVHLECECVIPGSPRNRASGTAKLPAAFNILKRGSMSAEQESGHAPRAAMRVVRLGNDPSQELAEVSLEDACVQRVGVRGPPERAIPSEWVERNRQQTLDAASRVVVRFLR